MQPKRAEVFPTTMNQRAHHSIPRNTFLGTQLPEHFFALSSFCQSELHREYAYLAVRILIKILARKTEVGARTLVYGASVGAQSHGQYVPDCKIKPTAGLTRARRESNYRIGFGWS